MTDGLNDQRTARVADLLCDFRTLQYYIVSGPESPPNQEDYYAEGWAALRQCSLDGQHILNCAAETRVPRVSGGPLEQAKAELQQVMLDAFARRHEGQKIYLRQAAAQRWVSWRDQILQGGRPHSGNTSQLASCDVQLRVELADITDDTVYTDLRSSDYEMGRWTLEDPPLRHVQRWLRARR
ncbi:Uncharacterized protein BP5553_04954 [Venustampulla echinocandica]|uniref:Uncharacterized protein n=1 Tax=Venustampulla echinocandica TaxID=2656787 RepID=A0A370TPR7_9HELO|nr:Uncharacterized protein BP5553_04954 [Venustampulla echinocandica]RDL37521.1 Uncharacterized protein BP5553_04954 [Venustampulla echinocandica]